MSSGDHDCAEGRDEASPKTSEMNSNKLTVPTGYGGEGPVFELCEISLSLKQHLYQFFLCHQVAWQLFYDLARMEFQDMMLRSH